MENICQYCGAHLGPGEVCNCTLSEYNRLTPENKRKVDSFAFALIDARSRGRDLHTTRNGGINMDEDERKFLDLFHKADTIKKIVIVAIMSSGGAEDGLDMLENCTRSDFKRAIRRLRVLQRQIPEYAAQYEEAIGYIRRVWLHREVPARVQTKSCTKGSPVCIR